MAWSPISTHIGGMGLWKQYNAGASRQPCLYYKRNACNGNESANISIRAVQPCGQTQQKEAPESRSLQPRWTYAHAILNDHQHISSRASRNESLLHFHCVAPDKLSSMSPLLTCMVLLLHTGYIKAGMPADPSELPVSIKYDSDYQALSICINQCLWDIYYDDTALLGVWLPSRAIDCRCCSHNADSSIPNVSVVCSGGEQA